MIFLLIISILMIIFFINLYALDEEIKEVLDTVEELKQEEKNHWLNFLTFKARSHWLATINDEDEDVFGWGIGFPVFFGNTSGINIARVVIYEDKPYKNKVEYLWQEEKEVKQKFLESYVRKLTMAMVKRQLKKRSLV